MIGARQLFKQSISFLLKNPAVLFYWLVYLIPVFIWMAGVILAAAGVVSLASLTGPLYLLFGALTLFMLPVLIIPLGILGILMQFVGPLGFTLFIQRRLHHRSISVWEWLKSAVDIYFNTPWAILVRIVYLLLVYTVPMGWVLTFAFFYFDQLLSDGENVLRRRSSVHGFICKKHFGLGYALRYFFGFLSPFYLSAVLLFSRFLLPFL